MRRFRFRLETVLRHRRALLRQKQREFGEAQAEATRLQEATLAMDGRRRECQEQIRQVALGLMARSEMLRLRTYSNALWLKVLGAGQKLVELRDGVEARRKAMVKARQDVRALEILREKALKQWQADADREERNFLDDLRPAAGLLEPPTAAGGGA